MCENEKDLHNKINGVYKLLNNSDSPDLIEIELDEDSDNLILAYSKYNENNQKMIEELKNETDKNVKNLRRLNEFEGDVKSGKIKLGCTDDLQKIYFDKKLANKKIKKLLEGIDPNEKTVKDFVFDNTKPENSEEYLKEIGSLEKYEQMKMEKLEGILKKEIDDGKKKEEELVKLRKFKDDVSKGVNKDGVISDFEDIYNKNFGVTQQNKLILEMIDEEDKKWNPFPYKKETYKTSEEYIKMINEFFDYQNKTIEKILNKYALQKVANNTDKIKLNEIIEKQKKDLKRLNEFEQDVMSGKNKIGANKDLKDIYETELKNSRNSKSIIDQLYPEEKLKPFEYENQKPETPEHYIKYISEMNTYQYTNMERIKTKLSSMVLSSKKGEAEKEKEIQALKKYKEDVISGKIKIGALADLKKIHEDYLGHSKLLKQGFKLSEDDDNPYKKFHFEDKTPESPEEYIAQIEEMNQFMKDYINKLKKRIDDMMDELRALRKSNNDNKLKIGEINIEKDGIKAELGSSQAANIKLKEKITSMEVELSSMKSKSVSASSLQVILKSSMEARTELNHITTLISKIETIDEFNYNISEENCQLLVKSITENTNIINRKITDLKPLIKNMQSTDTMITLDILNRLESMKETYLEVYGNIIDDDVDDNSEVDMSNAKGNEQILKYIYQNIDFLTESYEELQDSVELKVNNLIQARNKILQQRDKYHESCDDLTRENNKKTALIGKLQVKLYMCMTVLDNLEKLKTA